MENWVYNPTTDRMVKKDGRVHRNLIKLGILKKEEKKPEIKIKKDKYELKHVDHEPPSIEIKNPK